MSHPPWVGQFYEQTVVFKGMFKGTFSGGSGLWFLEGEEENGQNMLSEKNEIKQVKTECPLLHPKKNSVAKLSCMNRAARIRTFSQQHRLVGARECSCSHSSCPHPEEPRCLRS